MTFSAHASLSQELLQILLDLQLRVQLHLLHRQPSQVYNVVFSNITASVSLQYHEGIISASPEYYKGIATVSPEFHIDISSEVHIVNQHRYLVLDLERRSQHNLLDLQRPMDVGEMFYSAREPAYVVMGEDGRAHYGRRPRVVELVVPMCCAKCEEKVRESMLELEGVHGVAVDPATQRVTVTGLVDPRRALKKARAVKRDAHLMAVSGSPPPHHRLVPASPHHAPVLSSGFVHPPPASAHHLSYYRHAPAPFVHHVASPMVFTNPYYVKHPEYDGYWY